MRARGSRFLIVSLLLAGCGAALRPFPDAPIVREDDDRTPFGPRPAPRRSTAVWDAGEGVFFRPALRALSLEGGRQAVNVNALDEVPDSSWFEARRVPAAEMSRGACAPSQLAPPRPWRVLEPKTDGVQPGLFIEDARGRRHLLKTDGAGTPERSTAADAVGAALMHALGYHVPCNQVVFFAVDDLRFPPRLRAEVEAVIAAATPDARGRRASLSALVDGEPLGPWRYEGVWPSDPNDRVPHERRRELRALRWFFAWIDHLDAREHNTLMVWRGAERGHVEHLLIDFGDAFGAGAPSERRRARMGRTSWMDPTATAEDVLTLGLLPRPWFVAREAHPILGDFATEPFDPDGWRSHYDPGPFARADATDAAWAARRLATLTDAHLEEAVRAARFADPSTAGLLVAALRTRRDAILTRHLSGRSPLTSPRALGDALCLDDVAVRAGLVLARAREDFGRLRFPSSRGLAVSRTGERVCVRGVPTEGYAVVDVRVRGVPGPARVHLRDGRVVGLERPEGEAFP